MTGDKLNVIQFSGNSFEISYINSYLHISTGAQFRIMVLLYNLSSSHQESTLVHSNDEELKKLWKRMRNNFMNGCSDFLHVVKWKSVNIFYIRNKKINIYIFYLKKIKIGGRKQEWMTLMIYREWVKVSWKLWRAGIIIFSIMHYIILTLNDFNVLY